MNEPQNVAQGKRPRTPSQDEMDWSGRGTPPIDGGTPPIRQAQKRRSVAVGAAAHVQHGFELGQRSVLVRAAGRGALCGTCPCESPHTDCTRAVSLRRKRRKMRPTMS